MYIGNDLQIAHPSYRIIDDISSGFNGSTTSFALQVSGATPVPFPISTQQVMISVNGVVQEPDPTGSAGFKLLGSNIVFSSAPANGHAFFGVINAGADYVTAGSEFPDGSAAAPSFTFQDDQDTGWYRNASGDVGYSSNGAAILNFDGNGLTIVAGKGLTVDTSTLKVDAANNRVGIQTATPRAILDLGTNADAATISNTPSDYQLGLNAAQSTTGDIGRNIGFIALNAAKVTAAINSVDGGTNDTTSLAFCTGNGTAISEAMRIDSAGKVGIGETSMDALLVIKGNSDANTTPSIRLKDGSDTRECWISNTAGDLVLANGGDDNTPHCELKMFDGNIMRFNTANTERMRIDSSGRLLIGHTATVDTSTYNSNLQVMGTDAHGSSTIIGRFSNDAGAPSLHLTKSRNTTKGSHTIVNDNDVCGNIFWWASDGSDYEQVAQIGAEIDGTPGSGDTPGALTFSTTADGASTSTERMRIDSSGNVGIGVTSPSQKLHVAGTIINSTSVNNTGDQGIQMDNGHRLGFDQSGTRSWTVKATGGNLEIASGDGNGNFKAVQSILSAGTVSDSKGNLRSIPQNAQSTYTLVAADAGKHILATGNITVPNAVFSAGDAVTIVNNTASNLTITKTINTMYNAADGSSANRTLAARGMVTILFTSGTLAYISGAGLS